MKEYIIRVPDYISDEDIMKFINTSDKISEHPYWEDGDTWLLLNDI